MHNFKSHFWWDFLAYCTRPASVHLVMAFISCSFDGFSISAQFKTTKSHENYDFLHPFSSMAISPQNNEKKTYFILVNCMGWQICSVSSEGFVWNQPDFCSFAKQRPLYHLKVLFGINQTSAHLLNSGHCLIWRFCSESTRLPLTC